MSIAIHPAWAERDLQACLNFARRLRALLIISRGGRHLNLRSINHAKHT